MPLYEYRCKNCGQEFERIVRFSEAEILPECPSCSSRATQKKVSIFAAQGIGMISISTGSSCGSTGKFT